MPKDYPFHIEKYLYVAIIVTIIITPIGFAIYRFFIEDKLSSKIISAGEIVSDDTFSSEINNCGPIALQNICFIFGIPKTAEELARLAKMDKDGTTLLGLYEASLKEGLIAYKLEGMDIRQLKQTKMPAIAFLKEHHFVVIKELVGENLHIFDSDRPPYWLSLDEFAKIWNGDLICYDDRENFKVKEGMPKIQFSEYLYDFGEIRQKSGMNHNFMYWNSGKAPLTISNVKGSCKCVIPFKDARRLMPGERESIKIAYYPSKGGFQQQSIYVYSDDPMRPITILTLMGFVKPAPIIYPKKIFIAGFQFHDKTIKKELIVTGASDLVVKRVATNARGVIAQIVNPDRNSGSQDTKIMLSIDINNPRIGGEKLIIYTNDPETPKIEVPLEYELTKPITISQDNILFGIVQHGGVITRKLILNDHTDGNVKILRVSSQSPMISAELIPSKLGKQYELIVKLKACEERTILNSSVVVTTNHREFPNISIPVYAVITK